jgi:hypothetical protein
MWSTIRASDGEKGGPNMAFGAGGQPLPAQAAQSTWPTPTTRDHKDGSFCPNVPVNGLLGRTVWPTPKAQRPEQATTFSRGNPTLGMVATWGTSRVTDGRARLEDQAQIATYPTPSVTGFEAKDPERLLERRAECKERTNNGNGFGLTLGQFACLNTNGSSEPTEKRGALNPEFVCWLMMFPPEWLSCAPLATPSSPKLPPNSLLPSGSVSHDD